MTSQSKVIQPGSVIGIVGGGQLGRMIAIAAHRLGYKAHIFCEEKNCPASEVTNLLTVAKYNNFKALRSFAKKVDVVTCEFENIPFESLRYISKIVPVRPRWQCFKIAQNRSREKEFLKKINIETAPFATVNNLDELSKALQDIKPPCVLKTGQLGYDGKGQVKINKNTKINRVWKRGEKSIKILEKYIDFDKEISVIIARTITGKIAAYDPAENLHRNHILARSTVPAKIPDRVAKEAKKIARKIAVEIGLVGLLAIEMFVTKDSRIIVNELAPRPHNSGHWSIDCNYTSQFEQTVRAVCNLKLGSCKRHSNAVMENILGNEVRNWKRIIGKKNTRLHLYGKNQSRPGRKMGHITTVSPLKKR